jgi:5-methylcytosine-specific restriction endonuclease McrA
VVRLGLARPGEVGLGRAGQGKAGVMRRGAEPNRQKYRQLVIEVYTRDGWKCCLCKSRRQLSPHHILPRSQGGPDVLENLVTLCVLCHRAMDGGGWKQALPVLRAIVRGDEQ